MLKGHRRVLIADEFLEILEQIHSKDCLHAGTKTTYVRVFVSGALYVAMNQHFFIYTDSEFIFISSKKCG